MSYGPNLPTGETIENKTEKDVSIRDSRAITRRKILGAGLVSLGGLTLVGGAYKLGENFNERLIQGNKERVEHFNSGGTLLFPTRNSTNGNGAYYQKAINSGDFSIQEEAGGNLIIVNNLTWDFAELSDSITTLDGASNSSVKTEKPENIKHFLLGNNLIHTSKPTPARTKTLISPLLHELYYDNNGVPFFVSKIDAEFQLLKLDDCVAVHKLS